MGDVSERIWHEVKDKRGSKNQVADNLSRLEVKENDEPEIDINDVYPDEQVFMVTLKQYL